MKTIIENLKGQIESQKAMVERLCREQKSLWHKATCVHLSGDELNELSIKYTKLSKEESKEHAKLSDLRQALYYLLRASDVDNIDEFNPETSC